MRKRLGIGFVSLAVLTLLLTVTFATGTALAQQFISDTGQLEFSAASAVTSAPPAKGTGELLEGGALQIPAEQLNVPSLDELFGLQTESVIGTDSRTRVYSTTSFPSRAIAYLYVVFPNNAAGSCTGWFFGKRMVATAGHCVYSKADGGWAKTLIVYPGRNGSTAPYGATYKYQMWTSTPWYNSADHSYDYGLIRTSTAKGATVGYFGFRWQSSNSFGTGTVRGYPGDKLPAATQWTMNGTIYGGGTAGTVASRKLWYTIDTFGGQSGSPIFQYWNSPTFGWGYYGIGIHAYGVGYPSTSYNSGTRINQALFNSMAAKRALDP